MIKRIKELLHRDRSPTTASREEPGPSDDHDSSSDPEKDYQQNAAILDYESSDGADNPGQDDDDSDWDEAPADHDNDDDDEGDLFDDLAGRYTFTEPAGPALPTKLANLLQNMLTHRLANDKEKEILEGIKRPANAPFPQHPRDQPRNLEVYEEAHKMERPRTGARVSKNGKNNFLPEPNHRETEPAHPAGGR